MIKSLDPVSCSPFNNSCDYHAIRKKPEPMQLTAEYGDYHCSKSVYHAEGRIHKSTVNKLFLPERCRYGFQYPSRKAVDKKQPKHFIS